MLNYIELFWQTFVHLVCISEYKLNIINTYSWLNTRQQHNKHQHLRWPQVYMTTVEPKYFWLQQLNIRTFINDSFSRCNVPYLFTGIWVYNINCVVRLHCKCSVFCSVKCRLVNNDISLTIYSYIQLRAVTPYLIIMVFMLHLVI